MSLDSQKQKPRYVFVPPGPGAAQGQYYVHVAVERGGGREGYVVPVTAGSQQQPSPPQISQQQVIRQQPQYTISTSQATKPPVYTMSTEPSTSTSTRPTSLKFDKGPTPSQLKAEQEIQKKQALSKYVH